MNYPQSARDDKQYSETMARYALSGILNRNLSAMKYIEELCGYGGFLQRLIVHTLKNYMEHRKTSGDKDIDQIVKGIINAK